MKTIYLDNAATTLKKPPKVAKAVKRAINTLASPGRGGYDQTMEAARVVYECRTRAARLFSVSDPENVILTMNATHGLNIAIKSLCKRGTKVAVSGYEHNAVMRPLYAIGAEIIVAQSRLFDKEQAIESFRAALELGAEVAVCTHVSNVFGFCLPIYEIAQLCSDRGVPLIVDASQSAGSHMVNMSLLCAAFIAMPGHKGLYGPQGTGLLLCDRAASTLLEGGTGSDSKSYAMPGFLPDRLEAGTHNVPGAAGLNEGLKFVERQTTSAILDREIRLMGLLLNKLNRSRIRVFAPSQPESGVISLVFNHLDSETAAQLLAEKGVAVRAGLHCAPAAHQSAGTLDTGTVRVSLSAMSRERDVLTLASIVNKF